MKQDRTWIDKDPSYPKVSETKKLVTKLMDETYSNTTQDAMIPFIRPISETGVPLVKCEHN